MWELIYYLLDLCMNYYSNFSLFPPSQISYDKGEKYAAQINALFCETSALDATNVEELFIQISKSFMCALYVLSIPLSIFLYNIYKRWTWTLSTLSFWGRGIGGSGSSGLFDYFDTHSTPLHILCQMCKHWFQCTKFFRWITRTNSKRSTVIRHQRI